MDSFISSFDAAAKSSGLSGFLSSLNSMLNEAAENPGVFAHFLQQNQNPPAAPPSSSSGPADQSNVQTNAASSGTQTQNTASPDTNPPPLPTGGGKTLIMVKKIVSGLHRILEQLNRRDKNKVTTNQNQTSAQTATSSQTDPNNNSRAGMASGVSSSGGESDANDFSGTGTVTGNVPTLGQLLSELATLMQMIEKKLEMTPVNVGSSTGGSADSGTQVTDTTNPTTGPATGGPGGANPLLDALMQLNATLTGQTSDNSQANNAGSDSTDAGTSTGIGAGTGTGSVADPLTQLLALIQAIEQKLSPNSMSANQNSTITNTTAAAAAPQSTPSSLPVDTDLSEIHKDLKTLLATLQNTAANGNNTGDTTGANTSSTSISSSPSTPPSSAPKIIDLTSSDKTAMTPIESFFDLFANKAGGSPGNFSMTQPTVSPGTSGLLADIESESGNTFDGDDTRSHSGFDNMNTAAGTTANNPLPSLPEGVAAPGPYSFASQLSDMRAVNGGMTGLPSVIDQVLLQLNRGVKSGNDQMTIQLQPADLGKISIRLDISADNKVQGTVVADNQATLSLLLKDVRSLERALQEAGLRADPGSLQFSLGGQSGNSGNASGQTAGDFASKNSSGPGTFIAAPDTAFDITPDAGETWYLTPDRVNFKV